VTVRRRICEVLSGDPEIAVVGEAADGKQAIDLTRELAPDVITMDMMLPTMSGLAATEFIMAHAPTPILIVSSSTNRGELFKTYEALAAGAVDVLEKPRGDDSDAAWETRFLSTVKLVARIRVITHPRARLAAIHAPVAVDPFLVVPAPPDPPQVVAIGASTGGPGALVELLRSLPSAYRVPILLVLHIGEPFGSGFADWLDGQTTRRVIFARDGQPFAALGADVVMAPPDRHLVVRGGRLHLNRDPERFSCRPSVDVLFESVATEFGPRGAACLLTGMGRDGAAGLLAVRRAGGATIAQDEATSVVYGMPREAALLGAAARVLPLGQIGPALGALALSSRSDHK
jgi:two-component system chemotaxis response regulator CheB